ncbi:MAG: sel1 repeat family protein [Methylobacter sp.]|uniref:tetratricopeptide repeat protein n=1 Tax=Methylobacter sp. TaxID=2051955 RepID=UPI0025D01AF8|nr:tetratricopeptide repeat protein [Methylobacter sp.]MCK9621651.1 sel1 repeat family protein [Methylobacter sp.]
MAVTIIVVIIVLIVLSKKNKVISPIDEIKNLKLTNRRYKNAAGQISILDDSHPAIIMFKEILTKVENGDPNAAWAIGGFYESGNITLDRDNLFPKNREKALWWKIKAAEEGSSHAQFQLGQMYHFGLEDSLVKTNIKEAIKWYSRAVENGDFYALLALGELYFYKYDNEIEIEIPQDYKKAFEYLSRAIEHKSTKQFGISVTQYGLYNAALKLGEMYASGSGVKQDLILAYKWFKIGGFDPDTHHKYPLKGKLSESDTKKANELVEEWRKQHSNAL